MIRCRFNVCAGLSRCGPSPHSAWQRRSRSPIFMSCTILLDVQDLAGNGSIGIFGSEEHSRSCDLIGRQHLPAEWDGARHLDQLVIRNRRNRAIIPTFDVLSPRKPERPRVVEAFAHSLPAGRLPPSMRMFSGRGENPHRRYATQVASPRAPSAWKGLADQVRCLSRRL